MTRQDATQTAGQCPPCRHCAARRGEIDRHAERPPRTAEEIRAAVAASWGNTITKEK